MMRLAPSHRSPFRAYMAAFARTRRSDGTSSALIGATPPEAPTTRVDPPLNGRRIDSSFKRGGLGGAEGPVTFHNNTTNSPPPIEIADLRTCLFELRHAPRDLGRKTRAGRAR
jgi:hypothetical protein